MTFLLMNFSRDFVFFLGKENYILLKFKRIVYYTLRGMFHVHFKGIEVYKAIY